MKFKKIIYLIIASIVLVLFVQLNIYAATDENITNLTRAYFSSEVTKGRGNGDFILLENFDSEGNKLFGIIDVGKTDSQGRDGEDSIAVKNFLIEHNVTNLEFMIITHSHIDHNGDAITVLNNFPVKKIYMKQYDSQWSPGGTQPYEDIIKKAVNKNIKIIGTTYESTISREISPNASESFIQYMNENSSKSDLFEAFYQENVSFQFGSSNIDILNWEIFDENGNIWVPNVSTTKREIVSTENNNSLCIKLTQGNKKAVFSGDVTNLDKNDSKGILGDEDRIKDQIGEIDFLKLGHHGLKSSNTIEYLDTLKPKYAVITNDIGGADSNTIKWLNDNNVEYLYTTIDDLGVIATIKENEVYLGLEQNNVLKNINGNLCYICDRENNRPYNYKNNLYTIQYEDIQVTANSWDRLKELIEQNKTSYVVNSENKTVTIYNLVITLLNSENWKATSNIQISDFQNIKITTQDHITIYRDSNLSKKALLSNYGNFSIGIEDMTGTIILDGNKNEVESEACLIENYGTLNIYNNTILQNNYKKITYRVKDHAPISYCAYGSCLYSYNGTINMYGGKIINNKNSVDYTLNLENKSISDEYDLSCYGTGVYLTNASTFNMYNGMISNNYAENNSIINLTNTDYELSKIYLQVIRGVGIYSSFSKINIYNGEITKNSAQNNSKILAKDNSKIAGYYNGNYGIGMYCTSADISLNNLTIDDNNSTLNTQINVETGSNLKSLDTGCCYTGMYFVSSNVSLENSSITNLKNNNLSTYKNQNKDQESRKTGKASIGFNNCNVNINSVDVSNIEYAKDGGGIYLNKSQFEISNLSMSNCSSTYGGAIYMMNSTGKITNSSFLNNNSITQGGAVYISSSNLQLLESTVSNNTSHAGGGLYSTTNCTVEINNVILNENSAVTGNGGGAYAFGEWTISGANTQFTNNTANNYGGGLMVKTNCTINAGLFSGNNTANNGGGAIRVDGTLTYNGGEIKENSAKTYGGGIDYEIGNLNCEDFSKIYNNNAGSYGDDYYPDPKDNIDWTKDESLNLKAITVELLKSYIKGKEISNAGIQGMTITDKYIIMAQVVSNEENTILNIIDKNTYQLLGTIEEYCFGHVNDMTYNSNTKEIIATDLNSDNAKKIAKFKIDDNLKLTNLSYINCQRKYISIAYDKDDDYYIGYNSKKMYIMDNSFNEISSFEAPTELYVQGMAYWNNHIYFSCYESGRPTKSYPIYNRKEKGSNLIYVYDLDGNLEKTLYISSEITYGEIESVDFYENGNILLNYNVKLNETNTGSLYTSDLQEIQPKTPIPCHTLTINPNGGIYNGKSENIVIEQEEGSTINLNIPTSAPLYTVNFETDGSCLVNSIPCSMTFKNWTLQSNANGSLNGTVYTFGKGNDIIIANYLNGSINLPSTRKNGYIFDGWYTETNGGGTKVGSEGENYTVKGNLTLYANWIPKTYTIEYNLDGGTNNELNPSSYTIESDTITLKEPTKKGYTFKGWKGSNGEAEQISVIIEKGSTGNKTYTAIWEKQEEKIESDEYTVDNTKKIILSTYLKESVEVFRQKIKSNAIYKIVNVEGKELQNNDRIGTGCKVIGDNNEYTIIIKGDLNGNGELSINDLAQMQKVYVEIITDDLKVLAADLNNNEKIEINDLAKARKEFIK